MARKGKPSSRGQQPKRERRECISGRKCWRKDCTFWHPEGRDITSASRGRGASRGSRGRGRGAFRGGAPATFGGAGGGRGGGGGPPPCRYGSECRNKSTCMFSHPGIANSNQNRIKCKFGSKCERADCFYMHPGDEKKEVKQSHKARLTAIDLKTFTSPRKCTLSHVPDTFETGDAYFMTLIENCLYEYNDFFRRITAPDYVRARPPIQGFIENVGLKCWLVAQNPAHLPPEGAQYQLISTNNQFRVITAQDPHQRGRLRIVPPITTAKNKLKKTRKAVEFRLLGYIGNYCSNVRFASEMLASDNRPEVLKSVLNPEVQLAGDWNEIDLPMESQCNDSQRRAVNSLRRRLEVIQGPPGTGKSTTISEIIKYKCSRSAQARGQGPILVTTTRNKALDSIAEKLAGIKIVVFGTESRMGSFARANTLEALIRANASVKSARAEQKSAYEKLDAATEKLHREEMQDESEVNAANRDVEAARKALLLARDRAKKEILKSTRVVLSTIAATGKMKQAVGERVHTALIDEAGCMEEIAMSVILKLHPQNIVLIGDHKQLPPLTLLQDVEARDKKYDRSLMERFCAVSSRFSTLTIQYRMHKSIQDIVSKLYYSGQLSTGPIDRHIQPAVLWHDHAHVEEPAGVSYMNSVEVAMCEQLYDTERKARPEQTIMMISFYNPQVDLLRRTLEKYQDPKLSIVSVDGAQGSEADCVIISCVRSAATGGGLGTIGFLKDERRINVAISRAKEVLHLVGSRRTFSACEHASWLHVLQSVQSFVSDS